MLKKNIRLKEVPDSSGVYEFISKNNIVLYVGRAVNLRRRVSQYFQKDIDPRISEMVGLAKKISFQTTPTLWEAIILEANLIKKHQPKYNIRDKDNKSFAYLAVPKRTAYPQPFFVRAHELESRGITPKEYTVFGPFQGIRELQGLLKIIRRVMPVSMGRCVPLSGRPCFDYQIGLCPGACLDAITKQEYRKHIRNLVLLFSGKKQTVLNNLKKQNPEKAKALQHLQDITLLTGLKWQGTGAGSRFSRIEAYDISHFGGKQTYGAMTVMERGIILRDRYRLFKIKNAPANDDIRALEEMITRRLNHKEWRFPNLVVVDGGIPQARHIYRVLKSLEITVPVIGISKLQGDRFVFCPGIDSGRRLSIKAERMAILGLRDEAHRFCNKARKHSSRI